MSDDPVISWETADLEWFGPDDQLLTVDLSGPVETDAHFTRALDHQVREFSAEEWDDAITEVSLARRNRLEVRGALLSMNAGNLRVQLANMLNRTLKDAQGSRARWENQRDAFLQRLDY